jgi:hypothetical protein
VPAVAKVARYWCPVHRVSFGLLPEFYASCMPGTLDDLEAAASLAEHATMAAAAQQLRPADQQDAVSLPSALRWVQRRRQLVQTVLVAVLTALPALFAGCQATITSFAARLQTTSVLMTLRGICVAQLHALPRPLGLMPPPDKRRWRLFVRQQSMGPDPPRLCQ